MWGRARWGSWTGGWRRPARFTEQPSPETADCVEKHPTAYCSISALWIFLLHPVGCCAMAPVLDLKGLQVGGRWIHVRATGDEMLDAMLVMLNKKYKNKKTRFLFYFYIYCKIISNLCILNSPLPKMYKDAAKLLVSNVSAPCVWECLAFFILTYF